MYSNESAFFEIAHGYEETRVSESASPESVEVTHVIAVRPHTFDAERIAQRIRRIFPEVGVELDHYPRSNSVEFILAMERRNSTLKQVQDLTRRSVARFVPSARVEKVPGDPVELVDERGVFEILDDGKTFDLN